MDTNPKRPDPATALAGDLGRTLAEVVSEAQSLRSDYVRAEAARRKSNRILLGFVGAVAVLVAGIAGVTLQNNRLAHDVRETNQTLADCLEPKGKCYQQGQARTGAAINDIIRAELFMAECARLFPGISGPEYDRKLEACVFERLAGPNLRPTTPASPTPAPSTTTRK